MTLGRVSSAAYRTNNDISVHQDGLTSSVGRIGFRIGKELVNGSLVYARASLLHEFSGDYEIRFSDKYGNRLKVEDDFNDTWFEYGIGIAYQASENNHFYFDIERSTGSGMLVPGGPFK